MQSFLVILYAIAAACALGASATGGLPPPPPQLQPPQNKPQEVATSALGGGLVPDWARPSALLQSIVDRIRGTSRPCTGAPSGLDAGTCMLQFNCGNAGGVVVSSNDCPTTTVCCKIPEEAASTVSCGGAITSNQTSFRNPDFPADFRRGGMCSSEVTFGREVCQLRLDFVHFTLAPPVSSGPRAGLCDADVFTVATGLGSTTYPALCGQNAGQHMYVDVSEATRAVLSFSIASDLPVGRKWHVKVTFVHCLSPVKAPESCVQYYTAPSGEFSSFNFQPTVGNQQLIAGHKYSVCFKKQLGFCQITYSPSQPNSFQIGSSQVPLSGVRNCEDAYLFVPSGSNKAFMEDVTADRFCGRGFAGGAVTSDVLPFSVAVVTSTPRGTTSGVGGLGRSFDDANVSFSDSRRGVAHQKPVVVHPAHAMIPQPPQMDGGAQLGFVKGAFSVIQHVPHGIQDKPLPPHATLITVVERPDLAAGPGVKEPAQPGATVANERRGGFKLRYIMNHCN